MSSKGIISLGVGEPDFLTPWAIRDESIYRIEKGKPPTHQIKGYLSLENTLPPI